MMGSEDQVKQLFDDLGRALAEAIAASPDVTAAASHIRRQGFSLNLMLNCTQQSERAGVPLETLFRKSDSPPGPSALAPVIADNQGSPSAQAPFRLNIGDVAFLRSVGIDGTRPARRRRRT
jgi:hypothetical protein